MPISPTTSAAAGVRFPSREFIARVQAEQRRQGSLAADGGGKEGEAGDDSSMGGRPRVMRSGERARAEQLQRMERERAEVRAHRQRARYGRSFDDEEEEGPLDDAEHDSVADNEDGVVDVEAKVVPQRGAGINQP